MEKLTEAILKKFDERFAYLKLFDIVYDRGLNICSITFLFPYNHEEPSHSDREELTAFIQNFLSLSAKIRLKFKKSFLDDFLIKMEIRQYFSLEHKSVISYIFEDNINIQRKDFDINIDINLNKDILSLLDTATIKKRLKNYLEEHFIANFDVSFHESDDVLPSEIEYVDIPDVTGTKRYSVSVLGKFIGGDIVPKPEYIEFIDRPKLSVILAGTVSNITKKTFIIKKGKREGEEKSFYTFNLTDEKTIECIYFCPKSNEKKMESIKDGIMLLCLGDIKKGLNGKLTYYIKKMAYASTYEKPKAEIVVDAVNHTQVVFPEPIPIPAQSNLFEEKPRYNDFVNNNTIVVFDVETTGLDPETCEITELGAVKIVNGVVKEKFSTFVKPKGSIPEEVTRLTHITNEMVMNAPPIEKVIIDFYDYTRGCILSGYNIISFDMKFIKKAGAHCGLKFDNEIIDAYIVARQAGVQAGNFKLGSVVKALGLTLNDAHRAYNDAYATGLVLLELNKSKK